MYRSHLGPGLLLPDLAYRLRLQPWRIAPGRVLGEVGLRLAWSRDLRWLGSAWLGFRLEGALTLA